MNRAKITDYPGKRYIAAVAAAVIALGVNVLAYWLEDGYNLRVDATREQYTVLSAGTSEVLSSLNKSVYIYYVEGQQRQDMTYMLIKSYGSASGSVHIEAVDPGSSEAAALGAPSRSVVVSDTDMFSSAAKARTAVLSYGDMYPAASGTGVSPGVRYFRGEQKITSAIEYVAQEKAGRVVFLSGQDEEKPCGTLLDDIEGLYYGAGFVSADAPLDPETSILAVISPKEDISETGYRNIKAFLEAGGRAVFFIDNLSVDENGEKQYPKDGLNNFKALLAAYGIGVEDDVILGGNPAETYKSPVNIMPSVTEEGESKLYMSGEPLRPVLSYAGAISITPEQGVNTVPLLETGPSCHTVPAQGSLSPESASGASGAFIAGALAQRDKTFVAAFSSSSFITSETDYAYKGNSDLFLNTLKFLGNRQGTAPIPAKKLYDESDPAYRLTIDSEGFKGLLMTAAAGAPAMAAFIIGLRRWAKRRRL